MIQCPSCKATLPDGAGHCQFCGATFAATPPSRRTDSDDPDLGGGDSPSWVWPAYYGISIWWILSGVWGIIQELMSKNPGSFWSIVSMGISAVTALVGLGLILRVEQARGIVNVLCFLQILNGVFGLLGGFVMSFAPIIGIFGAIAMIVSALDIVFAILMIFVIGETESLAPNF
jgi:hypothetical protein